MADCILTRRDKRADRSASAVRRHTDPPDAYAQADPVIHGSWEVRFSRISPTDDQVVVRIHAAGSKRDGAGERVLEDHTFTIAFTAECPAGAGPPKITRSGDAAGGEGSVRYYVYTVPRTTGACVTMHFFAAVCFALDAGAPNISLSAQMAAGGTVAIPLRFPPSDAQWDVALGSATWCAQPAPVVENVTLAPPAAPLPAPALPVQTTVPVPELVPQRVQPAPAQVAPQPSPEPVEAAPTRRALPIGQALADELVTVKLKGVARGVTAACNLELVNRTDHDLDVVVARGVQFVPAAVDHQVMVCTAEVEVSLPPRGGGRVTTSLPTICASPFGYKPPPMTGRVAYHVRVGTSPVVTVLDLVENLSEQLGPIGARLGMPAVMFEDAVGQHAAWAIFGAASGGNAPFGVDEIAAILKPQLARADGRESARELAADFWAAANMTVIAVDETAPETMEAVVTAGLAHTRAPSAFAIDQTGGLL
jgi:hypothetical protein